MKKIIFVILMAAMLTGCNEEPDNTALEHNLIENIEVENIEVEEIQVETIEVEDLIEENYKKIEDVSKKIQIKD